MVEQKLTGYPSIDKPWLKYYSEAAINTPLPECTIYEYLWQNNKDHLEDIALKYFERAITYKELFANIDKVSRALTNIGVTKNDVVTLQVLNQPETVYLFYALNRIGATTCVVNVLSSVNELVHYLEECRSKFFITLDIFIDKAMQAAKIVGIHKVISVSPFESSKGLRKSATYINSIKCITTRHALSWKSFIKNQVSAFEMQPYQKGRCAVIGHTGGTTGTPKGVKLTDDSFNSIVHQYLGKWEHRRQESFLALIVPFAIYGLVVNLHLPLCAGMTVILIPKVVPKKTYKLLQKYKPNHVSSIPSYWKSIAECEKIGDLSFLKTAGAGGASPSLNMIKRLNSTFKTHGSRAIFLSGYGLSEVGSIACTQNPDCAELGSVGIPLPQVCVSAFDPKTGKEKMVNEVGEICINSPSTMIGYVNNEAETNRLLQVHEDGRLWVHTGDIGYISPRGAVFISGRMKRIYITQQDGAISKIFPERIEHTIKNHAAIKDCAVVCCKSIEHLYVPVAFLLIEKNMQNEHRRVISQIQGLCLRALPEYAQPRKYFVLNSLPLTPVGKVDFRALEHMAAEQI